MSTYFLTSRKMAFARDYKPEKIVDSLKYAAQRLKIDEFKDLQASAISSVLKGEDVFISLPTGFGKSAIYQALPMSFDFLRSSIESASDPPEGIGSEDPSILTPAPAPRSIALVISPLISLMRDQANSLSKLGIQSVYFGDVQVGSSEETNLRNGHYSIVYMSPESALSSRGFALLECDVWQQNLCSLVVDESHCVVKWGLTAKKTEAFRSCYGRIAELRSIVPRAVPMVSLTATSSIAMRDRLRDVLCLTAPKVICSIPDRPNIFYNVVHTTLPETPAIFNTLMEELREKKNEFPRTIVFCRTHPQCHKLYKYFRDCLGDEYRPYFGMYHATTEDAVKEKVLKSFASHTGNIRILFSTIAFGMGIDCKDLRRVYHFGPSSDIEDYVQESGRGGRGGEPCFAILVKYVGAMRHRTSDQMKAYMQNDKECRRKELMAPFGIVPSSHSVIHKCCDVCAKKCSCGGDTCQDPSYGEFVIKVEDKSPKRIRILTEEEKAVVKTKLLALRGESQTQTVESPLYSGEDLTGTLSIAAIDRLVASVEVLTRDNIALSFPIFRETSKIWEIVSHSGRAIESQELELEIGASFTFTDIQLSDDEDVQKGVIHFSSDSE